jgi:hypothetical protein
MIGGMVGITTTVSETAVVLIFSYKMPSFGYIAVKHSVKSNIPEIER